MDGVIKLAMRSINSLHLYILYVIIRVYVYFIEKISDTIF